MNEISANNLYEKLKNFVPKVKREELKKALDSASDDKASALAEFKPKSASPVITFGKFVRFVISLMGWIVAVANLIVFAVFLPKCPELSSVTPGTVETMKLVAIEFMSFDAIAAAILFCYFLGSILGGKRDALEANAEYIFFVLNN